MSTVSRLHRSSLRRLLSLRSLALFALAGSSVLGCGEEAPASNDDIVIGLLLPFTGSSSATGSNFERSVLYAADRINAAGGIQGRRVRILAQDTHSDLERSHASAQRLIDGGAHVVLGPESANVAASLHELFVDNDVVFISPFVGDAGQGEPDCETPWFRLAPSAKTLGEALGNLFLAEGLERVAIVSSSGSYDAALATAAAQRFSTRGGEVAFEAKLDPSTQSYASTVRRLKDEGVEGALVAASPRSAALLINESDATVGSSLHWFFSPLLKTELFTSNVIPEAIEGGVGVVPKLYDTSEDFPEAFAERWAGDQPLEGSYFYYDAMAVLALALEQSEFHKDGSVDASSLRENIIDAAAPPGEAAGWDEIEKGLRRQRAGKTVYYSGLTGPLLLNACGSRRLGVSSVWTVEDGAINTVSEE